MNAQAKRVAIATVGTALLLIAYYAVDRSRAAITSPGIDPALVIASERVEYFWRVSICGYLAPLVFVLLFFAARGREERLWPLMQRLVAPFAIGAAVLATLFP